MTDRVEQFGRGIRRGLHPGEPADGPATTTRDSLWLHDICPDCHHSFRVGDLVLVHPGPPLTARHRSHETEPAEQAVVQAFYAALDRTDPPPAGTHRQRMQPGHPLLADAERRRRCFVCNKTVRLYDVMVICPCRPGEPRCRLPVHSDPQHSNDCYAATLEQSGPRRCPTSLQVRRSDETS